MKYKYYIWDVGGTLFDTTVTSVKAFSQVLREFGQSATDKEIYKQLKETSTGEAADFFIGKERSQAFQLRYHAIETPMQENPIMSPGARETLEKVVENGGKNFIISHRDLQVVDFLETCHLIHYCSYVITSNDHFARKPSPESILYLIDRFGVEPDKALMIGDRELDVLAGKNAGISSALYAPDGFIQVKEADYTIRHLSDALSLGE